MAIEHITLITGDRHWKDRALIDEVIATFPDKGRTIVITGGQIGVDALAAEIAVGYGCRSMVMKASWAVYSKSAGPIRNVWMLDLYADLIKAHPMASAIIHAFHPDLQKSKGTVNLIKQARPRNYPVVLHGPTAGDVRQLSPALLTSLTSFYPKTPSPSHVGTP